MVGNGIPITFLHGFTQTANTWIPVLDTLSPDIAATLIDAPGHGSNINGKKSLTETAHDIAAAMPNGMLVGYSMGARMALHTALLASSPVNRLVLISGTGGIDSETERAERRQADEQMASRIKEIGVPSFIDEWLSLPMFANLGTAAANIPERLRNTAEGLADSLTFAGTGTQTPLWDALPQLTMPVLILAGANDTKFVAHGQRMHELIPNSSLHVVPDSGHTVHLEQPSVFAEILQTFISSGDGEI